MSGPPLSAAPEPGVFLSCIAGPDQGKRGRLSERALLVGRAPDCHLLSDDPDVAPRHAALTLRDGIVRFQAIEPATAMVDGHPQTQGPLQGGQQLRLGRSTWMLQGALPGTAAPQFLERLGEKISAAAGVEKIQGFSLSEMFSEVLKQRSDEEVEAHFNVGTRTTTPELAQVDTRWPRPWAFFKIFSVAILVYFGFVFAWNEFGNPYLLPGLIIVGSVAIPVALLVFFFEMNVLRNISLYQLIKLVVIGGLLSIVVSLFGFRWTGLEDWLGAASAGIVEESGKTLVLIFVASHPRWRWTLNGLLLGAAVGTGFAVFETAGYAFYWGLLEAGPARMLDIITTRGVLSVLGGHALYTGLVGAALWRVRGARPFDRQMLLDPRFLRVFGLVVLLHMLWNSPIELPFHGKYLAIGFVVWVALLSFIQDGLRQVRREQLIQAPTMAA